MCVEINETCLNSVKSQLDKIPSFLVHKSHIFSPPQVKSGTIFDNFLITDDEKYAEEYGEETWGQTKDAEKKMKDEQDEEERKKAEEAAKAMEEEEGDEDEEGDNDEEEEFDTEEVSKRQSISYEVTFLGRKFVIQWN